MTEKKQRRRILLEISYDGTNYSGWQRQENAPSVQQVIEKNLFRVTGENIDLQASGRTDAGVHALRQIAHFDTCTRMPADKFAIALNIGLPDDVRVLKSKLVDQEFHARFDAKKKHYRYTINHSEVASAIHRNTQLHVHAKVDVPLMKSAAELFLGTHNFKAFMSIHCPLKNNIRTIYDSQITQHENLIYYDVIGSGFLRHMVRIMVGTLIDIGRHRKPPECIVESLETKCRASAGSTAPAHGLTLVDIQYI